ncbi:uncharacterized protein LOC144578796 [Callithrix jacchus]
MAERPRLLECWSQKLSRRRDSAAKVSGRFLVPQQTAGSEVVGTIQPPCLGRTSPGGRGRTGLWGSGSGSGSGSGPGSASAKGPARRIGAGEARRPAATTAQPSELPAEVWALRKQQARPGRGSRVHYNRGGVRGRKGGVGQGSDRKPRPHAAARSPSYRKGGHGGREAVHKEHHFSGEENEGVPMSPAASHHKSPPIPPESWILTPAFRPAPGPPPAEGTPPSPANLRPRLHSKYPPVPPALLLRSTRPQSAHQDPYSGPQPGPSLPPQPAPPRVPLPTFPGHRLPVTLLPYTVSVPALDAPPTSQACLVPLSRPVPRGVRLLQEAFLPAQKPSPSHQGPRPLVYQAPPFLQHPIVLLDRTSRVDSKHHVDSAPVPGVQAVEHIDTEEAPRTHRDSHGSLRILGNNH